MGTDATFDSGAIGVDGDTSVTYNAADNESFHF